MPPQDSLTWTAAEARRLRDRGALKGKSWSLAQVCEHLALAIHCTVKSFPATTADTNSRIPPEQWSNLGTLQRTKRRIMKRALLWSGRIPEGVPAPEFVVPSTAPDLDSAIQSLESAAAAFDRKLANPNAPWPNHPLLGPMPGPEWRRFHDLHARHHFKFMKPS